MWLNVIRQAKLNTKQCWPAVFPHGSVCGVARGCVQGLRTCINSLAFDVILFVFHCWAVFVEFTPSLPIPLGMVSLLASSDFQCDSAWWFPLTGYRGSWGDTNCFYWMYNPTQRCFLCGQLIRLNPINMSRSSKVRKFFCCLLGFSIHFFNVHFTPE